MEIEITPELLKSIASAFHHRYDRNSQLKGLFIKFQGNVLKEGNKVKTFANNSAAKTYILNFLADVFHYSHYYDKTKTNDGFDYDFSEAIKLKDDLNHIVYSHTKFKPVLQKMRDSLLADGTFTIEKC